MQPTMPPTVHPWHGVPLGEDSPDIVNSVVEIPRGGPVKYELDKETGLLRMDRVIYPAVQFPANYGFLPQTLAEDDDPLDILALCKEPVTPLTLIRARPIGLLTMLDDGKRDHKVIAVAIGDPAFSSYRDVDDLRPERREELERFFKSYKSLEDAEVEVQAFESADFARQVIHEAAERYRATQTTGATPHPRVTRTTAKEDVDEGPHVTG